MSKTLRSLNLLLVLLTCAASIWAWMSLPQMESYPIHWNARGEADGFSSKVGVAMVLSIMPLTAIFTHGLLWFLTKADSVKESVENSGALYDIIWHGCLWLYLGCNVIFAVIYMSMAEGQPSSADGDLMLKFLPAALGLFFIVVGNVMGKARQNKFVGVKTPWTFKSKSTWDATHRVTAWLWVGAGLAMIIAPFVFAPTIAVTVVVALVLIISFAPITYSYVHYQSATDKQK